MSDLDVKQEMFEAIRALANAAPAMRVSQLVAAAGEVCSDLHGRGLWDADDSELLASIWKLEADIQSSTPADVQPNTGANR